MIRLTLSAALLVLCSLFFSSSLCASGLPAKHEAARLMLSIEAAVGLENWKKASKQLSQLQTLEVALVDDFFYFNGLVLSELALPVEAQASLERYVIQAGEKGKYYTAALSLITALEERIAQMDAEPPLSMPVAPTISGDKAGYIESLKALFLTDDTVEALSLQINSLLSAHAYTGSRVKKAQERRGLAYSLSVEERDIVLQERRFDNDQVQLSVTKVNVLGIAPYLKHDCSLSEYACWLYEPTDSHAKWLVIDHDPSVAQALNEAITKLILHLQQ